MSKLHKEIQSGRNFTANIADIAKFANIADIADIANIANQYRRNYKCLSYMKKLSK